jgi:flagellar basal-body rod protein FlgB
MMDKLLTHMGLFDRTIGFIERSLDLRTSRHRVLSTNIANADTPGYTAKEIPFQEVLEHSFSSASTLQVWKTHPDHLSGPLEMEASVEPVAGELSIDQEMAKLAENNVMFLAGVQTLIRKLEALRLTISEGR